MKHVVVSALLLFTLIACRPPADGSSSTTGMPSGMQANIELAGPAEVGPVPVRLQLSSSTGEPEVSSVTITGDMTHAGMVPVIVQAVEESPGTWLAADFSFNMGGDWFLLADVELADGTTFDVTLPVSVSSD